MDESELLACRQREAALLSFFGLQIYKQEIIRREANKEKMLT
jgi:hypothetical protein